jgi:hypothetical protein
MVSGVIRASTAGADTARAGVSAASTVLQHRSSPSRITFREPGQLAGPLNGACARKRARKNMLFTHPAGRAERHSHADPREGVEAELSQSQ